jgi:hypothetical protein
VTPPPLGSAAADTGRGGVRPTDEWRVCGQPYDDHVEGRGCTCHPAGPNHYEARAAVNRLSAPRGDQPDARLPGR